jgi:hypothetical protein
MVQFRKAAEAVGATSSEGENSNQGPLGFPLLEPLLKNKWGGKKGEKGTWWRNTRRGRRRRTAFTFVEFAGFIGESLKLIINMI